MKQGLGCPKSAAPSLGVVLRYRSLYMVSILWAMYGNYLVGMKAACGLVIPHGFDENLLTRTLLVPLNGGYVALIADSVYSGYNNYNNRG